MPVLAPKTRVLPPIKNPVFSLTEANTVAEKDFREDEGRSARRRVVSPSSQAEDGHSTSQVKQTVGNNSVLVPRPPSSARSEKSKGLLRTACSPRPDDIVPAEPSTSERPRRSVTPNRTHASESLLTRREKSTLKLQGHQASEDTGTEVNSSRESYSRQRPGTAARISNIDELREAVFYARASGDTTDIQNFLTKLFESFSELNRLFKLKENHEPDDPNVNFSFLEYTYDSVIHLPKDVQKITLRSIIGSLLKDSRRERSEDDMRAILMILLNPQFGDFTTFVIFAHLLRQVTLLSNREQEILVRWLRRLPLKDFKAVIGRLHEFISIRLFPAKRELPPMEKCVWWIPTAVKVLAMFYASNYLANPPLVPHPFFYCNSIGHIDLIQEFQSWQQKSGKFSFCQFPFLIGLTSKRYIMQKDSEMKMISEARESLVQHVRRREMPNMGMLFLNLKVRRAHLVSDSLNEIAVKKRDLKKKLRVTFHGEPGLDMGGLTKEWFLLLVRKIFREEYGMFTCNPKTRTWWFNCLNFDNEQEFNLVGVLMGLAVYNSIVLDIRFPSCCYKKLLSPAVVPYNNPHAPVGVCELGLDDLSEVNPDLSRGLRELLAYDGDVEEDLCQTFQISYSVFGQVKSHNLKRGGDKIPVTNRNREEYVKLYVDYLLNTSIYRQFFSFYHGFHSVCASNAIILLRPEEVEMLVCGDPSFDMEALKKVTTYDGFSRADTTIRYFWEVVLAFKDSLRKKLLSFTTGSDRIPIGGMSEMQFKISRMDGPNVMDMLPTAHTCFNQLCLPAYRNKKVLKQKLTIAISNAEGFGIE